MSGTPTSMMTSHAESLVLAGSTLERHLTTEGAYPSLLDVTKVSPQCLQTASGLNNLDYVRLDSVVPGLDISQVQTVSRMLLPREITEHARASHFHSMRGLFPEIKRAWMTIDSDLYVWTYEQCSDTAYYDRLTETIVGVALVKPRKGVFQTFVRHLLVLCTSVEVVILGVTYQRNQNGEIINLLPEPVYQLPSEGIVITTTIGTEDGRIFQGGDDGNLYEIVYQGNEGWFGKSCKRVNHTQGVLSYLIPSFLSFSERDSVAELVVDSSRHLLYMLTKKGTIKAYSLGDDAGTVTHFASISEGSMVQQALNVVRTLDGSHFRPIVGIQAIERGESSHLHMVAVTGSGVRIYFTTHPYSSLTPVQQAPQAPSSPGDFGMPSPQVVSSISPIFGHPVSLNVVHIRLPPGYTAQAHSQQPQNVYQVHYKRGTCLMVSKTGDRSTICCVSRDLYPSTPYFAEIETQLQTDTQVFAVEECPSRPFVKSSYQEPPLIVSQHMENPTKYVTLTSQGVQVHVKLRPSDILKAALLGPGGPESNAVKTFFSFLGDEQACAIALQLACLEESNPNLSEFASRAFLYYGSDSRNPQSGYMASPLQFQPHTASTPISGARLNPVLQAQGFPPGNFSSRHEGLYLFLARILRPVWSTKTAILMITDNKIEFLVSGVECDLLSAVCTYLEALKLFLQKNATIIIRTNTPNHNDTIHDNEERRSLIALRNLVSYSLEILGLWKVLCEHQFHVLAEKLTKDQQHRLCGTSFKDLVLSGSELCLALVNSLITMYLDDNASIDALSAKLRDVCPTFYRQEDASCSKAKEILLKAHDETDPNEKSKQLNAALTLLQKAAPHVSLPDACQQFASCQFYEGIVKLCTVCAKSIDPYDAALMFYINKEPSNDMQGHQMYARRMECYKETINALNKLYGQPEDKVMGSRLLKVCLSQDDYLLRIAVYDWLIKRGLLQTELLQRNDILINNNNAPEATTLEGYLDRLATSNPTDQSIAELLWTMYEKTGKHFAAAQILKRVAESQNENLTLEERTFCLSRAILCMRAETVGYSKTTGHIAKDLEDEYEVARLQVKVLEHIKAIKHNLTPQSLQHLSRSLVNISELYEDYAVPLNLFECQLDIMHCASNEDQTKILEIWQNLIRSEVHKAPRGTDRMGILLQKVESIGKRYGMNPNLFPLSFLVRELEVMACKEQSVPGRVHKAFLNCGMSAGAILEAYGRLLHQVEWVWSSAGNEFHLSDVVEVLIKDIITNESGFIPMTGLSRREVLTECVDIITACLNFLYTKSNEPQVDARIKKFRDLQTQCTRLGQSMA